MTKALSATRRTQQGQALAEFGLVLPVLLLLVLGVVEFGYAIYRSMLIDVLAREGSNLISRETTIQDAETALRAAASTPVRFDANGRVIFSVIKLGTGGSNRNRAIISQRYTFGSLAASSVLGSPPSSSYNAAPDYLAKDADNDASIRIGTLPNGLTLSAGQAVYVTEIFVRHSAVSPITRLGITMPSTLYASAYF
jgi:hypothetical protein